MITFRLLPREAGTPHRTRITPTSPPAKPAEPPQEIKAKVEAARAEAATATAPKCLHRPHPIIAHWLAEHDRWKQEARSERDPWRRQLYDPGNFDAAARRQHRILDALFKALEKQGGKVAEGERGGLQAEMQGERIEFLLREKQKQVRRPLTDEEQRWASPKSKGWRYELQSTAKLVLTIKTYLPGRLRTEWIENDKMPMEALLPDIVATFVAVGPLLVEQRIEREEAERLRRIAERERYEEEQRQRAADNRWRRFVEVAHQQREAEIAREFLTTLKEADFEPDQQIAGNPVSDWIAWAERRLTRADPLSQGVNQIFEALAKITPWTYRD